MKNQNNIAEVLNIKKNILGTLSIILKVNGMRKAQDFSMYPISKDSKILIIQSETRIAKLNLDGAGLISKTYPGGAYFPHLNFGPLTPFKFSEKDWRQIVEYIGTTQGDNVGSSVVKSDNSGAKSIFNL